MYQIHGYISKNKQISSTHPPFVCKGSTVIPWYPACSHTKRESCKQINTLEYSRFRGMMGSGFACMLCGIPWTISLNSLQYFNEVCNPYEAVIQYSQGRCSDWSSKVKAFAWGSVRVGGRVTGPFFCPGQCGVNNSSIAFMECPT